MKNTKKIIITVVALAFVGGAVYWYQNREPVNYQQGLYPVAPGIAGKTIVLSDYIRYPGKDSKNAFELLKNAVGGEDKVKFKESDFGVFIEEINGLKPDADHFWKLYINGKDSQVAADKLETKKGDIIEWVVEKVQQ